MQAESCSRVCRRLGSRWGFLSAPGRSCKAFATLRSEKKKKCDARSLFGDACFGICLELGTQTSTPSALNGTADRFLKDLLGWRGRCGWQTRSHSVVPFRATHCRSFSEPFQQVCSRLAPKNHGLLLYALFSVKTP